MRLNKKTGKKTETATAMRLKIPLGSVKSWLIVSALLLALVSLWVSARMVSELRTEEYKKMEVWAEAVRSLNHADEHTDLTLVLRVLNNNTTIPTIVRGKEGGIQDFRNIKVPPGREEDYLQERAGQFDRDGRRIRIYLQPEEGAASYYIDVLYDDSEILKLLRLYPYAQLLVVLLYAAVAVVALLSLKRSEQNKVWVGLSKETAHQLGTPISSLMAWTNILHSTYPEDELIGEMDKDVARLQLVADRFSKIGSVAELSPASLHQVLDSVVDYLRRRVSKRVQIVCAYREEEDIILPLNVSLFEWVVEVLLKNAVDAMQGEGRITLRTGLCNRGRRCWIEVTDTGKGIVKSKFNAVFRPGYTTKKRGWGLGLSLAKRIVEEYHRGHIFVKRSELNVGTTFRIELRR